MSANSVKKRILYVATDDWFFKSHFLHVARRAKEEGYEAALAASLSIPATVDELKVFSLHRLRAKKSPFRFIRNSIELFKILRMFKPDLVHVIGLQNCALLTPVIFAGCVAKIVLAPTGLGRFWIEPGLMSGLGRSVIRTLLKCFQGRHFHYVFENDDDRRSLGIDAHNAITVVGGAGVDETHFVPLDEPSLPVRLAVVARMTKAKGIVDAVEAVKLARAYGADVSLDLYGAPDPFNTSSLTEAELHALDQPGIKWHGTVDDVRNVWRTAHIAVLLSRREGLPRSLVEAAACGRAILATDVTGCNRIVRNGIEGQLVPSGDIEATAKAVCELAQNHALRARYGSAARARVCDGFTQEQVATAFMDVYAALLSA